MAVCAGDEAEASVRQGRRRCAVFAAGGTGGHIMPALAVAQALCRLGPDYRIVFLGTGKEIEKRLVIGAGFPLIAVPSAPWAGRGLAGVVKCLLTIPRALVSVLRVCRREQPDVVVGFGGYPSVVPFIAAWLCRIPCILHEQNVEVGLANRLLSLFATRLFSVIGAHGFWSTRPVRELPNPVRLAFSSIPAWQHPAPGEGYRLLVVGGSQGAVTLNDAVLGCLDVLDRHNVEIAHQAGELDLERLTKAYSAAKYRHVRVVPFFDDIVREYEACHLVICRAGALTVAEVGAAGRPAIFVPLRIARGHQAENAKFLVRAGAARLIEQNTTTVSALRKELEGLLADPALLSQMARASRELAVAAGRPAAEIIAEEICVLAGHKSQ